MKRTREILRAITPGIGGAILGVGFGQTFEYHAYWAGIPLMVIGAGLLTWFFGGKKWRRNG